MYPSYQSFDLIQKTAITHFDEIDDKVKQRFADLGEKTDEMQKATNPMASLVEEQVE